MALAKWFKIDFHTHTPESNCFTDKSITAKMWLKAAKDSGLNAVVITDHNSVGFISKVEEIKSEFEKDNEFKVFYGIELCVSAEFTHFLIIFDDKMPVTNIEDAVISCLELKRGDWRNTEINVSEDKLKKLCQEYGNSIFIIPAHFASNKGLGTCNINAIKKYQEFLKFAAIEVRNDNDIKEYKNKVNSKVINKAVLITGSDNPSNRDKTQHSIEGFGKMFTWMKMSTLSFEGLRQVFIDPEHRCINWLEIEKIGVDYNPNEIPFNYIAGIKFNGISHMSDMNMRFSPNLNCIVGGRGTGKSTILSAINYGVINKTDLTTCKLLDKTFDKNGSITTFFNFGSSKEYKIEVTRKGKYTTSKLEDNNGIVTEIPEFKIDFYGQKEIFSLIEEDNDINNQTISPLVKMIDNKISTELLSYKDDIEDAMLKMITLSSEYKSNQKKIQDMTKIKAEIEKNELILKKFQASGIEKARFDYDLTDKLIKTIQERVRKEKIILIEFTEKLTSINEDFNINLLLSSDELEKTNKNLYIISDLEKINNEIVMYLKNKEQAIDELKQKFESSDIHLKLKDKHKIYLEALEKIRNTGGENIDAIQDQLQDNRNHYDKLKQLQIDQLKLKERIEDSISKFIVKRFELFLKRKKVINELELDTIKINIIPFGHILRWKANLQKEFGKEGIFDSDFEKLCNNILLENNNFENYRKFLEFLLIGENKEIEDIFNIKFDQRFNKLWSNKQENETLSSLVKIIPEDKLNIKLVENSGEIDINEGSPGQKSAAILAFILNSGDNPLIIDQPEDDLDNSLIYSLIVKSIRKMKSKRQIIIVTHNPNIPVLGDAEGILILDRNSSGKVTFRKDKKAGCIEERVIREGICEIMEGGELAFKKREEKYLSNFT